MAAATVASLAVEITGDIRGLNRAFSAADKQVKGFGSKLSQGLKDIGGEMTSLGTSIGTLIAPLAGFGVAGVMVAADFEASMNEISARTGIVGEDLEMIRQFALKMGADTSFSAQQASDAFLQLLSSGSSATEAMATLPAVLDLAAASGMDLGYTADVLTDIMAQFGLEVSEAVSISDTLAKAAGASSASVAELAQGFSNVGPVANLFGMTVEETAAALATLAENGIKGAEGGTALKSMLLNLSRPTDEVTGALNRLGVSLYDSEGNMRRLDDVIDDLDVALDALPMNEQIEISKTLAGSYGIVAFSALRASGGIDEMQAAMTEAAGAQAVAEARLKGFNGATEQLTGSIETLMINALTPFMEKTLTPLVQKITGVVNSIGEWAKANPELSNTVFTVTAVIAGLSAALITGGLAISAMGTAVGGITALFGAMGTAITIATGPVGILVAGIGILAATVHTLLPGIVESWGAAFAEIGKFIQHVIDQVTALLAKIGEVISAIPGMQPSSGDSNRTGFENLWNAHGPDGSHATGLRTVPNDGYRAILHRGEAVLKRGDADAWRRGDGGNGGGVTVNVFPSNLLGSRQEVVEWVREGMAEAGL
jgi:TP901 family phage tail tape measure protein